MLTKVTSSLFIAAVATSASVAANPDIPDNDLTIRTRECSDKSRLASNQIDIFSTEYQTIFKSPDPLQSVPLPHPNPTKSFWIDTPGANPLADEGSTGPLSTDGADVCIIGSGITGVGAAWHLNKMLSDAVTRRKKVVILEARRFCSGATGRNGGHLTRNVFSSFHTLSSLYNTSEALKSYDLEAHTANSILKFINDRSLESEMDLVRGGHVSVFKTVEEEMDAKKDWEGVRDARKEAGEDTNEDIEGVEWINADEMHKRYGIDRMLNYSGARFIGHNLWPCKLVTQLYKDISSSSMARNIDVSLHTKTPVTNVKRISNPDSRRWALNTPRGEISCDYVVHATNGYAAHLLPILSGSSIPSLDLDPVTFGLTSLHPSSSSSSSSYPSGSSSTPTLPRGAYGIRPTRGQVGAVRASVNASTLQWLESWDDGPEGWNYWFPRYQDTISGTTDHPLIILGGERRAAGDGDGDTKMELGNADDSVVNPFVSSALRKFLPEFYEGRFDPDGGGWEMEWTGIMAYTKTGDPFVGPVVQPFTSIENDRASSPSESEYEGQYIAAGYSGHGMPRAYGCAEAVAGMIVAKMKGEVWTKPPWLPERYLTWATKA